jgi:hypothetical protein
MEVNPAFADDDDRTGQARGSDVCAHDLKRLAAETMLAYDDPVTSLFTSVAHRCCNYKYVSL